MLKIDGSQGEGGGQILRSALTLSMTTGTEIEIHNIRAGRSKPGLMRQHLACVKAAAEICQGDVDGAELGSTQIRLKPGKLKAGSYRFSVGTAGSTALIFQTVMPALALLDHPSILSFEGGTHNDFAPSVDFLQHAFLPAVHSMGFRAEIAMQRHGFYPQGGGLWQATVHPAAEWQALQRREAGELQDRVAVAISSNIPKHVARRELNTLQQLLSWNENQLISERVDSVSSGNFLSLRLHYQHHTELIEQVGKVGLSAEKVARKAVDELRRYQLSGAVVGEHLADQLLLPMALARGGRFTTCRPSLHSETNRAVIEAFTDQRFQFTQLDKDCWEIEL